MFAFCNFDFLSSAECHTDVSWIIHMLSTAVVESSPYHNMFWYVYREALDLTAHFLFNFGQIYPHTEAHLPPWPSSLILLHEKGVL